MRGQLDLPAECLPTLLEETRHLRRVRHSGRVAETDLRGARVDQPARDFEHALRRHLALVWAPERQAAHPVRPQPSGSGARDQALQIVKRLLDRAPDVVAVVRLRGGENAADLLEARAMLE